MTRVARAVSWEFTSHGERSGGTPCSRCACKAAPRAHALAGRSGSRVGRVWVIRWVGKRRRVLVCGADAACRARRENTRLN